MSFISRDYIVIYVPKFFGLNKIYLKDKYYHEKSRIKLTKMLTVKSGGSARGSFTNSGVICRKIYDESMHFHGNMQIFEYRGLFLQTF